MKSKKRQAVRDAPPEKKIASGLWPIIAAMGLSSLLLGLLQMTFIAASPAIIAAIPATPAQLVTPWVRSAVTERDGIETYVVLPGMLFFLVATVGLAFALRKVSRNAAIVSGLAGALAAAVIILRTRSSEFFPSPNISSRVLLCVAGAVLIWAWYAVHRRASVVVRRICLAVGFVLFAVAVVLSQPLPTLADYGYFIGPALKLLQGERLGSFYMQYSLLESLLFTAMVSVRLKVHVMEIVLSMTFIGWYFIYWLIAKRMFRQRFMALLCMVALVITRFLAIRDHPVMLPQVLPVRLDLWAPLLLAVIVWGLVSWRTSLAFAVIYALDSTFGFLFAAVYAGSLFVSWLWASDRKADMRLKLPLLLPSLAAGIFQRLVFGSWVSSAATHYLGVQIGFLPISGTSLFWPIVLLVGWSAAVFAWRHTESEGRIGLLICAFAVFQFVYFFGRSHDHNLLNVSSIWLLAIFLAVDQALENTNASVIAGTILILALTVMSTQQFTPKFTRIADKIRRGIWVEPDALEEALDSTRGAFSANTVFVDSADAYLNYRLGLSQRGYFVPFAANVFMDDTARWMDDQVRDGMRLRTTDARWSVWAQEFNETPVMKQRGRRFVLTGSGVLFDVVGQDVPSQR